MLSYHMIKLILTPEKRTYYMENMLLQHSKHQEALDAFNQALDFLPHYDKLERAHAQYIAFFNYTIVQPTS
jgi:hypothetical protein